MPDDLQLGDFLFDISDIDLEIESLNNNGERFQYLPDDMWNEITRPNVSTALTKKIK